MATITLTVTNGGIPVAGATVVVRETLAAGLTTNEAGQVAKTVPADYAAVAGIFVLVGGSIRGIFDPVLLRAGDSQTLEIGATAPPA